MVSARPRLVLLSFPPLVLHQRVPTIDFASAVCWSRCCFSCGVSLDADAVPCAPLHQGEGVPRRRLVRASSLCWALAHPLWVLGLWSSGSFTCLHFSSRLRILAGSCSLALLLFLGSGFHVCLVLSGHRGEASFEDWGALLHPLKVWSFLGGQSTGL